MDCRVNGNVHEASSGGEALLEKMTSHVTFDPRSGTKMNEDINGVRALKGGADGIPCQEGVENVLESGSEVGAGFVGNEELGPS